MTGKPHDGGRREMRRALTVTIYRNKDGSPIMSNAAKLATRRERQELARAARKQRILALKSRA